MKKRDIAVIGVIILLALLLWTITRFSSTDSSRGYAQVYLDGLPYAELSLASDELLTITQDDGKINQIEVSAGRIRMRSANCPDHTCVACGWLDPADRHLLPDDRWIVCLPNRVSIELIGD